MGRQRDSTGQDAFGAPHLVRAESLDRVSSRLKIWVYPCGFAGQTGEAGPRPPLAWEPSEDPRSTSGEDDVLVKTVA